MWLWLFHRAHTQNWNRQQMLQSPRKSDTSGHQCVHEASAVEAIELTVIGLSDRGALSTASDGEDQQLLQQADDSMRLPLSKASASTEEPGQQSKVLFLDGLRGLAAILVVVQHSREFMPDLHLELGAVGVDVFFVLSSFLLTWIFMKKSIKLLDQGASLRTWAFTCADYFQRRFFRVYPLFFVTVVVISLLSVKDQRQYFLPRRSSFNMTKTLLFVFKYRYHVFWTLPLEITYYFVIPVFVLAVLGMRRLWWIAFILLTLWIVNEGVTETRRHHMPLKPHISTFLTGSIAAVVWVKVDLWIQKTKFVFKWWHTIIIRAIEGLATSMLLSVCFRGLLFHWVHKNPAPPSTGFPYTSAFLAIIILIEVIKPSWVSTMLEWNVLRFWGKISFSVYLMHSFVIYNPTLSKQADFFDRLFSRLVYLLALSSTTYYLIEYPSLLLAKKMSMLLMSAEKQGLEGWKRLACMERISTQK